MVLLSKTSYFIQNDKFYIVNTSFFNKLIKHLQKNIENIKKGKRNVKTLRKYKKCKTEILGWGLGTGPQTRIRVLHFLYFSQWFYISFTFFYMFLYFLKVYHHFVEKTFDLLSKTRNFE